MEGQTPSTDRRPDEHSLLSKLIRFCIDEKLVVVLVLALLSGWGIAVAPFDWNLGGFPRSPVPVDAIPDLGENQQIVFAEWPGRSPQDIEDQLTYPLTVELLGISGVREVRSSSMFGFASVSLIFEEDIEFYWARSRILEKLASLPEGRLPNDVKPSLGPDATGLGQAYLYTLEGRDPDGKAVGGWDLRELRSIQDWHVRYALLAARGVSEVASIGGYVQEYQVDLNPDALREKDVSLAHVLDAVRRSNLDVGARTTEINSVEYVIRGRGFVKSLSDLEQAVVRVGDDRIPVRIGDVAVVSRGPAERRGILDDAGSESVGGIVTVRQGFNTLEALNHVKDAVVALAPSLPAKAIVDWQRTTFGEVEDFAAQHGLKLDGSGIDQESWTDWLRKTPRASWPAWVTTSQVTVVPYYDRSDLIGETLGTLESALTEQLLVTLVVVLMMLAHLRASIVVGSTLPFAVLLSFIAMKLFGVDANVVALAGIAIAIGTIVDMGIVVSDNVLRHLELAPPEESRASVVHRASVEVGSAIVTAIATTVVSFLPVFTMTGAEGKLFRPLAYTKTFVLLASVVLAVTLIPMLAHLLLAPEKKRTGPRRIGPAIRGVAGAGIVFYGVANGAPLVAFAGSALVLSSLWGLLRPRLSPVLSPLGERLLSRAGPRFGGELRAMAPRLSNGFVILFATVVLSRAWEPLGPERGGFLNFVFVAGLIYGLIGAFLLYERAYPRVLRWVLANRWKFMTLPVGMIVLGMCIWLGFDRVFSVIPATASVVGIDPATVRTSRPWSTAAHAFPGLGREFMPALDEGTFLWMPTTMPHASLGEVKDILATQNMAIAQIPEVEKVVGKAGRAETALDPAPLGMIETVIQYHSEYRTDEDGNRLTFQWDASRGEFARGADGELIPDPDGRPFRQWRDHIRHPNDIWDEIVKAAHVPGATSAPKLQPIETRQVMLQTGMNAAMGVKVRAPDLASLDRAAVAIERVLRKVPGIEPATVNAERVVGTPYLEIDIDRAAIARYGLSVEDVQSVLSAAVGGTHLTTTVEGRERYPVRVRYQRERRNEIDSLERVLVPTADGAQVPLRELADIRYDRGPQMIRSENTFLTAYVTFGGQPGLAEVDVVDRARAGLDASIDNGELLLPSGVHYSFAGTYEHQLRASKTLAVVLPVALLVIFLILYFQFRRVSTTVFVFSGIAVAWGGAFFLIWLMGQEWFGNFSVFGANFRELFQFQAINLSVAVWVGFLALSGIAVDDGVIIATFLDQTFEKNRPKTVEAIRQATFEAAVRRARPCLMTTVTTILALVPVLMSTGKGSDIMIPMSIPTLGGMTFAILTMFTVPVLYSMREERKLLRDLREAQKEAA